MRIHDVTLSIHPGMPVWPGDPNVQLERISKIEDGANANVSRLSLSAHTGTHVDAPYHFLGDSPITVEKLSLDVLVGDAFVLHLPDDVDVINREVLARLDFPSGVERLLFRTRNSNYWAQEKDIFQSKFVGIDAGAASFLVDLGLKLVGIDYLSIAPYKNSRPTHEILLKAQMVIIEGLDLSDISQGHYDLYCLPMKLRAADGAPARVILVER